MTNKSVKINYNPDGIPWYWAMVSNGDSRWFHRRVIGVEFKDSNVTAVSEIDSAGFDNPRGDCRLIKWDLCMSPELDSGEIPEVKKSYKYLVNYTQFNNNCTTIVDLESRIKHSDFSEIVEIVKSRHASGLGVSIKSFSEFADEESV